jgi:glycosyltransferase involved in cell wall biosynthesis
MPMPIPTSDALVFALPEGSDRVSGGNIYNGRLIAALRASIPVDCISLEESRARIGRGEAGRYVIDSLDLDAFLDFPAGHPDQSFTLIVHHLPSLEPDLDGGPPGAPLRTEQAALARFDSFLTTSPFTARYLIGRGHPAERILTVPPPPPEWSPALSRSGEDASRIYVPPMRALIVGNLIPRKAMRALFVALEPRLAPAGDELSIDVVGRLDLDPEYARRCRDFTEGSARLASIVRYRGGLPPAGMPAQYQAANVFVSASRMETFGMALQEAHAQGLPILALDGGYVRHHFTDGQDGRLFFSLEALADGLLELVRDPQRAAALFARAQGRAQAADRAAGVYDWPAAAQLFLTQLAALR